MEVRDNATSTHAAFCSRFLVKSYIFYRLVSYNKIPIWFRWENQRHHGHGEPGVAGQTGGRPGVPRAAGRRARGRVGHPGTRSGRERLYDSR